MEIFFCIETLTKTYIDKKRNLVYTTWKKCEKSYQPNFFLSRTVIVTLDGSRFDLLNSIKFLDDILAKLEEPKLLHKDVRVDR